MIRDGKLPRVYAISVLLMIGLTLLLFHPKSLHTLSSPHKALWNYLVTNVSLECLRKENGNALDCTYDNEMTEGCSNRNYSAWVKAKVGRRWEMVKNLLPPGVTLSQFNKFLQQQASFLCIAFNKLTSR